MQILSKIPIWRSKPISRLTTSCLNVRPNNQGRIVSFHRFGSKRKYRIVDYRRRFVGISAVVLRFERSSFHRQTLACLLYTNGVISYIPAIKFLKNNDYIWSGPTAKTLPGFAMPLRQIPIGQFVHNIEKSPNHGGVFVRAAGVKAQIIRKLKNGSAVIKLPSGEYRSFNSKCYATIGMLLPPTAFKLPLTKAGHSYRLGRRPVVRGVAMNPIDHPHGGGEGKTSGGRPSCSPWGILTKGYKTRSVRKLYTNIVQTRHYTRDKKKGLTK